MSRGRSQYRATFLFKAILSGTLYGPFIMNTAANMYSVGSGRSTTHNPVVSLQPPLPQGMGRCYHPLFIDKYTEILKAESLATKQVSDRART